MGARRYEMQVKVWRFPEAGGWRFVTFPKNDAENIKIFFAEMGRGWGSLPVAAGIGKTSWNTSIFPDKELASYVLPLSADIRQGDDIAERNVVTLSIAIK